MKSLLLTTMSVLASATMTSPSLAAETSNLAAVASPATARAVAEFVRSYADRTTVVPAQDGGRGARDLVLYPTADRSVVFVTYRYDGAPGAGEQVGLVQTRDGRVCRYTDLSARRPKQVSAVTVASRDDAHSQARLFLQAGASTGAPAIAQAAVASWAVPASAQRQAADLLRAVPQGTPVRKPHRVAALAKSAVRGDSQAMARAVLTASVGE